MNYDEKETLPISRNEFAELEIFKNIQFEKLIILILEFFSIFNLLIL